MSDVAYKAKEAVQAELQARLDAHFAEKGITGKNFEDSGRSSAKRSGRWDVGGHVYKFEHDASGSYVCVACEPEGE